MQTPVAVRDRIGLDDQCFKPPATDEWRHAWKLTERLIHQMNHEVVEHGSKFAMAVVTSGIQVTPDAERRREYCEAVGVSDLSYADERLSQVGMNVGFPVVVLSEELRHYGEKYDLNLHGFPNTQPGEGHWNAIGHREAARVCAEQLMRSSRSEADEQ
jgi:hypothetical protein